MYTRAACSDYDDWETIYGNPGWGSKDLIPLLEKVSINQVFGVLYSANFGTVDRGLPGKTRRTNSRIFRTT
jgi:hypothetical protein